MLFHVPAYLFKMTDILLLNSMKEKVFNSFHIFMGQFIVYYNQTLLLKEDFSNHIPSPTSIYFFKKNQPGEKVY